MTHENMTKDKDKILEDKNRINIEDATDEGIA